MEIWVHKYGKDKNYLNYSVEEYQYTENDTRLILH